MSLVQCAKCGEEVFLPAGASPQATVRCPFCSEEFELSEILNLMPPSLTIVNDPNSGFATSETESADAGFSFGGMDDSGPSDTPAFDATSSSGGGGGATTLAKPVTRSGRKKAPPKNAVFEIIKIVGGGVAGIALAILIIWWGVRTDPFGFAPNVAKYVPFIVPEHLRGDVVDESETDAGEPNTDTNAQSNNQGNNKPKGNKQAPPDPNAFQRPLGGAKGPFSDTLTGKQKEPSLDGSDIDLPEIDPLGGDSPTPDPFDLPGTDLGELDPDSIDPDLNALNPDLNELNPDLNDLNPDLNELNPDLNPELNPDLESELNPEIDPEADPESDPEADPESDPAADLFPL